MSFAASDYQAMAAALRLAQRGIYTSAPNPRVGCVLVRDGEIVGRGWHQRAGEAHAEVLALADAGDRARGATAYVTLEPCCHQGRTPPCTDALLQAGVARVVAAVIDPNPQVAGQGLAKLAAAGVVTTSGLLADQATALNPGHFQRARTGRPWLRCKVAVSLDGRSAMASGESQWITGAAARRDVQCWRARSCALMTGIGTVLHDNPRLDLRAEELPLENADEIVKRQPLRVVLDSSLRLPANSRLLQDGAVLVFTANEEDADRRAQLVAAGAEVLLVARGAGGLDLAAVLAELGRRELNEVQVEAGPALNGALLRAGLVDELLVYQAARLLGSDAQPLASLPIDRLDESVAFDLVDSRQVGVDLRLRFRSVGRDAAQPA